MSRLVRIYPGASQSFSFRFGDGCLFPPTDDQDSNQADEENYQTGEDPWVTVNASVNRSVEMCSIEAMAPLENFLLSAFSVFQRDFQDLLRIVHGDLESNQGGQIEQQLSDDWIVGRDKLHSFTQLVAQGFDDTFPGGGRVFEPGGPLRLSSAAKIDADDRSERGGLGTGLRGDLGFKDIFV